MLIANSRGPQSLTGFGGMAHLHPATLQEAGQAEIVILTVPWRAVGSVLGAMPEWNNRILIDATNAVDFLSPGSPDATDPANPLGPMGLKAVELGEPASSALVADLAPGARVVKTFNHVEPAAVGQPKTDAGRLVVFLAGDDSDARSQVAGLLHSIGLFPVDLGRLAVGGSLIAFPGGSLLGLDLVKP